MQSHVGNAESQLAYKGVAAVVVSGTLDLGNKLFAYDLVCLVMPSGHLEEFFFNRPVFHNLGREFNKVPCYGCACQGRIFSLAHYAVQSVPEFVENGCHLAEGQKRRFGRSGLGEVADDGNQGPFFRYASTVPEGCHPGSASLALPGKEVAVKKGQMTSVLIKHVVNFHVFVVSWNVLGFHEADSIEAVCKEEKALLDILELEERLDHIIAETVSALAEFFTPVGKIPALESAHSAVFFPETMFAGKFLNSLHVLFTVRKSLVQKVLEERVHGLGILCHPVFQCCLRRVLEPQEVGRIHSQFQYPSCYGRIVIFPSKATGAVGKVHLFPQFPFRREFHES